MTPEDAEYFKRCHKRGLVKEPLLDVGSARIAGQQNIRDIAMGLGLKQIKGADIAPGSEVDYVANFGLEPAEFERSYGLPQFATVCVFNVLEHTFDPVRVLGNAVSCVSSGGSLLVVTPSIWPIHDFPRDCNRLLPDWYREFARQNRLRLVEDLFLWLSEFGMNSIPPENPEFPTYRSKDVKKSWLRYWSSRIGHRLLNTYGRNHWATHCAIGAAFQKNAA